MGALTICGVMATLILITMVSRRLRRSRSEQCRQWLGPLEEAWSDDELDALRASDVAA